MPGHRAQSETPSHRLRTATSDQRSPNPNRTNRTFLPRPFCLLTPPPQIRETMRLQSRTFRFTEGYDHDIANG